MFTMQQSNDFSVFFNSPLTHKKLCALTDDNWGPQDASYTNPYSPHKHLDIFKSRSVLGYIIWLNGPLHWISKRQYITTQRSNEAEIYATDEFVKILHHITNILE